MCRVCRCVSPCLSLPCVLPALARCPAAPRCVWPGEPCTHRHPAHPTPRVLPHRITQTGPAGAGASAGGSADDTAKSPANTRTDTRSAGAGADAGPPCQIGAGGSPPSLPLPSSCSPVPPSLSGGAPPQPVPPEPQRFPVAGTGEAGACCPPPCRCRFSCPSPPPVPVFLHRCRSLPGRAGGEPLWVSSLPADIPVPPVRAARYSTPCRCR